jgi:hypothetical protein
MAEIQVLSNKKSLGIAGRILALVTVAGFNFFAYWDIWNIPWGKGFNKWGFIFVVAVLIGVVSLLVIWMMLWRPQQLKLWSPRLLAWRKRLGIARWVIGIILVCLPACILQFTYFGILLTGPAFRFWLWAGTAILIGILFTREQDKILDWPNFLAGLLVTGSAYAVVSAFKNVTSYPFSLYWSEGNRFWDYSILFGRGLYDYPAGQPIFTYIDLGRQITWGLPFLLPHWSIVMMRFWDGLLYTVPYAVLGWLTFKTRDGDKKLWPLLGLWAYLFLNQGPIYTPLVICAILVAIAWRRPLWLALLLVAISGYFAQLSRWTWIFAPAIWAAMLELGVPASENQRPPARTWLRAMAVALAGLFGKYLISFLVNFWQLVASGVPTATSNTITGILFSATAAITGRSFLPEQSFFASANGNAIIIGLLVVCILLAIALLALRINRHQKLTQRQKRVYLWLLMGCLVVGLTAVLKIIGGTWLNSLTSVLTDQPLLWYRLFPNATYGTGILIGLMIASSPLAALLIYLRVSRRWKLSSWQQIVILFAMLAFLGVGLVASVKIGGGGDLHNLDMFLIGMLFVAALAWRNGKFEGQSRLRSRRPGPEFFS